MKRPRKRVKKAEIVSSTAFALAKNPNLYNNVKEYEPDQKKSVEKRMAKAEANKQAKFADVEAKIKAAFKKL